LYGIIGIPCQVSLPSATKASGHEHADPYYRAPHCKVTPLAESFQDIYTIVGTAHDDSTHSELSLNYCVEMDWPKSPHESLKLEVYDTFNKTYNISDSQSGIWINSNFG
jgi:hypothetical protein